MIYVTKHYHNRRVITELAEDLATRKIDYEEGLQILNETYQSLYTWYSEPREKVIDRASSTCSLDKFKDITWEDFDDYQFRGEAKQIVWDILKDDVSDILLSYLVELAFGYFDTDGLINKDIFDSSKIYRDFFDWCTHLEHTQMLTLYTYDSWITNDKFERHKYFKIDRALDILRRSK